VQNAVKIPPGRGVKSSSTVFATLDSIASYCCNGVFIERFSPGVWFKVAGKGDLLRASTCGFTSPFYNSIISVYKGGCDNLTCVADNDDANDWRGCSEDVFPAKDGEEYLVLVNGWGLSANAFELSVDKVSNVVQDGCFSLSPRLLCCTADSTTWLSPCLLRNVLRRSTRAAALNHMNLLVATMLTVKPRTVPQISFAVVLSGTLAVLWKLAKRARPSAIDASFCICDAPRVSLEVQIWTATYVLGRRDLGSRRQQR